MIPVENPSLFTELKDWLEVLYYFCNIIVMFFVGFGLWQLKLTKDQISVAKDHLEASKEIFKQQSKRSSVEAAVVECRRFSETLVHDSLALDNFCKDNSITYFDDVFFKKVDREIQVNTKNVKKEDVESLSKAEDIINRFINGLETYALFFLSGIADEEIAFHTNAKTFIEFAEIAFKIFPVCNIEKDDAEPIKALYFMWHEKQEAKRLKIERKEIDSKLANYNEKNIKSMGT